MLLKLEYRLGVQAPAEIIWEVIADLSGWAEWNPLYPHAAGTIGYGQKLKLSRVLPGHALEVIEPVVLDWAPSEALHWRLSSLGGLIKSTHYLEIEIMSETGCVFSAGEIFYGFLGVRRAKQRRTSIRQGFAALCEAMRDRAEALWRLRQDETT